MLGGVVEDGAPDQGLQLWQQAVELTLKPCACRRQLISTDAANQQVIVEECLQSLERATRRRLAQKEALGGRSNVQFFGKDRESDQQIQIDLAQLLPTHEQYAYYA